MKLTERIISEGAHGISLMRHSPNFSDRLMFLYVLQRLAFDVPGLDDVTEALRKESDAPDRDQIHLRRGQPYEQVITERKAELQRRPNRVKETRITLVMITDNGREWHYGMRKPEAFVKEQYEWYEIGSCNTPKNG